MVVEGLVIELDGVISFLKAFLKLLDLELEALFFLLVLGFEGEDLVVGLIGNTVANDWISCRFSNRLFQGANLSVHFSDTVLGKDDLLSHNVDLILEVLILTNGVIESYSLILKHVHMVLFFHHFFVSLNFGSVTITVIDFCPFNGFFLFEIFCKVLFVLILQDEIAPKIMK